MKSARKRRASAKEQDSEKEWEVEKILKERPKRRKNPKTGRMEFIKEYLVKWVGYNKPSWEPEENLEHSKEILKDFLITQLMKTVKSKKSIQKSPKKDTANQGADNIASSNKIENKRKASQKPPKSPKSDEPSTLSNCLTNNTISNKKRKNSRRKTKIDSSLTIVEDEENNYYDIEIVDDKDEGGVNNEISTIVPIKKPQKESSKQAMDIVPMIQEKKTEKNNIINNINVKTNDDVGKVSETIYIDGVEEEDEENNKYGLMQSKVDKLGINKADEFPYVNVQKEKKLKFLERKRHIDIHQNDLNDKNIKILHMNCVKIPENNEDKIKVNVRYMKNDRIYVEDYDYDKIPQDYLISFYNILMKEYFAKGTYYQEVCFN